MRSTISGYSATVPPSHRLGDRVVWLVGRASLHAQRLIQGRFAASDLRKQHYGVLASLADVGAAAQASLADRICVDRSDMVSLLDQLEALGCVERRPDPTDRRRKIVHLTGQGRDRLRDLDGLVHAADDDLLAPLSPDERATLVELLSRILPAADRRADPSSRAAPRQPAP